MPNRETIAGRSKALGAIHLAAIIFGSTILFGKINAAPVWIVAGRTAFAAAALGAILIARRAPLGLKLDQAPRLLTTAALLAVHWVAFFAAVQLAGVPAAALTVSSFPLFTVMIEAMLSRRRPTALELGAGCAVIVAVALVAGPGLPDSAPALVGVALGLSAAALFAIFALISRPLVWAAGPLRVSFVQYALVTVLLGPLLPFADPIQGFGWWWILALGVIATALPHQLYLYALAHLPPAACAAVVSLEPLYAIVLAALIFAEPISPIVGVSAALIVGASWLLLRRPSQAGS